MYVIGEEAYPKHESKTHVASLCGSSSNKSGSRYNKSGHKMQHIRLECSTSHSSWLLGEIMQHFIAFCVPYVTRMAIKCNEIV